MNALRTATPDKYPLAISRLGWSQKLLNQSDRCSTITINIIAIPEIDTDLPGFGSDDLQAWSKQLKIRRRDQTTQQGPGTERDIHFGNRGAHLTGRVQKLKPGRADIERALFFVPGQNRIVQSNLGALGSRIERAFDQRREEIETYRPAAELKDQNTKNHRQTDQCGSEKQN